MHHGLCDAKDAANFADGDFCLGTIGWFLLVQSLALSCDVNAPN